MPNIHFIYQGDDYCAKRETVCKIICDYISTVLPLPDNIEIVFAKLGESEYGTTIVDKRFPNRLSINTKLTYIEVPHVLVHELIHLHQIKTGILSNTSDGKYIWNKRIFSVPKDYSYKQYSELPWELDVKNKEPKLLSKVLEILNTSKV